MRQSVRELIEILSRTLRLSEPIYEFGACQSQPGLSDMRQFFPGKEYIGCDIREGPGVDRLLNIHQTGLPSESAGSVLILETLEHVQFPVDAMKEVYRILRPNGIVVISSVMNYPIHDTCDYWRFTPDGFRTLLRDFPLSLVEFLGEPSFPHTIIGIAIKGQLATSVMDNCKQSVAMWKRSWHSHGGDEQRGKPTGWKEWAKYFVPPVALACYHKVRERLKPTPQGLSYALPARTLGGVFPGIERIRVTIPCSCIFREAGTLPLRESLVLASICKFLTPRRIFEIGTYKGMTTLLLAMHTPPETDIFTLDLFPARSATKYPSDPGNVTGLPFTLGEFYRGTEFESRIHQLYGDSALFDFEPFHGTCEFVLIDGNHTYENVKLDTENAFRIVRPGGVVIWDDYDAEWGPGVMRALHELAGKPLHHIVGTRFAICRNVE